MLAYTPTFPNIFFSMVYLNFYIVWHRWIVALLRINPDHAIIFVHVIDSGIFMSNYLRNFVTGEPVKAQSIVVGGQTALSFAHP